jgi:SET domain-containing protein
MNKNVFVMSTEKKGVGVFAKRSLKKGELIVRGKKIKKLNEQTDYSFQVDLNTHVQLNTPARLINHSCDPNLGMKNNSFGGYDFIALRNIESGEEITWDYAMTELVSIAIKEYCQCKTNKCRGIIGGFLCLTPEIKARYGRFIADYLKRF